MLVLGSSCLTAFRIDNMNQIVTFKCETMEELFPTEVDTFFKVFQKFITHVRKREKEATTPGDTQTLAPVQPVKKSKAPVYIVLPSTPSGIPQIPPKSAGETGAYARQCMRSYLAQQFCKYSWKCEIILQTHI